MKPTTPPTRERTEEEILKLAIDKAQKNGFNPNFPIDMFLRLQETWLGNIFSHDFAKAFWNDPDDWCCDEDNRTEHCGKEVWKWHLQKMVISTDPIRYLEGFL